MGDGVEPEFARAGQSAELELGDVAVRDAGRFGQAALAPALGVAQAGDALPERVGRCACGVRAPPVLLSILYSDACGAYNT